MKMTRQQQNMINRKKDKEAKKLRKLRKAQFTKLCEWPAPEWLTKDIYQEFLETRDELSKDFQMHLALSTLLGNFETSKLTYNEAWGYYDIAASPKFLSMKYLDGTLLSSPDSGQDSKTYSIDGLRVASKHAARHWGWNDKNNALNPDGSPKQTAPSQWTGVKVFNIIYINKKLVIVPIDCEHRLWGVIGFPMDCVPMPENYEDLYFYHPDLPERYDEELETNVRRVKINGLYLSEIVNLCHEKGAVNVTEETIKERFWSNTANFRFLPSFSRFDTERYFGECNDTSQKSLVQLFHAKPNETMYWIKDFSSIKVTEFEPSGKSLHELYNSLPSAKLFSLESLMLSVLVGEYNILGRKLINRGDKFLTDSFAEHNEYSNELRVSILNDLDLVYSLTSKYINLIDGKDLEPTRPLILNLLHMNDKFEDLGYCIADKALFINSWQEWFEDNQETNTGEMTIFAGHWRKAGNFKQTFKLIQEDFLNDFDKETLRSIGVVKQPLHQPRAFSKKTITDSYNEENGLDIDGSSFVHPVGGHIISDMELARMTEEEKNQAFSDEGLGDTFDFDKNCRAMSGHHNRRMGVLRLSEYMKVINDSDEIVKDKQRQKYEELKSKDILV
jgi:hypothetical protein